MTTRHALTHRIRTALDIDETAAADLTDTYIRQVAGIESIDPDAITDDQAAFILEAARRGAAEDISTDQRLADLADLSERIRVQQQQLDGDTDDRNRLLIRFLGQGVSVAALVDATGLNRSRIYAIRDAARKAHD